MRSRNVDVNPSFTTRIVYGYSASNGTLGFSSGDVSITRTGTGAYTLNFQPPFIPSCLPILTVMPYGGMQYVSVVVAASAVSISIVFATSPGGAGIDTAFYFHVMGPGKK